MILSALFKVQYKRMLESPNRSTRRKVCESTRGNRTNLGKNAGLCRPATFCFIGHRCMMENGQSIKSYVLTDR